MKDWIGGEDFLQQYGKTIMGYIAAWAVLYIIFFYVGQAAYDILIGG